MLHQHLLLFFLLFSLFYSLDLLNFSFATQIPLTCSNASHLPESSLPIAVFPTFPYLFLSLLYLTFTFILSYLYLTCSYLNLTFTSPVPTFTFTLLSPYICLPYLTCSYLSLPVLTFLTCPNHLSYLP